VRKVPQIVIANGVEEFQFGRMRDKMFGPVRQSLRDDAGHRFE
jgi:hypothetical protein